MPLYMYQAAYTPESWAAQIKNPQNRVETVGRQVCEGTGTPQTYAKAIEWYNKAAEQGTGIDDTLAALTEIFRGLDKK